MQPHRLWLSLPSQQPASMLLPRLHQPRLSILPPLLHPLLFYQPLLSPQQLQQLQWPRLHRRRLSLLLQPLLYHQLISCPLLLSLRLIFCRPLLSHPQLFYQPNNNTKNKSPIKSNQYQIRFRRKHQNPYLCLWIDGQIYILRFSRAVRGRLSRFLSSFCRFGIGGGGVGIGFFRKTGTHF